MIHKGMVHAIGAYLLWGVLPVYWKTIHSVPSLEISGHRIIWSFVFVMAVIVTTGQWSNFREAIKIWRNLFPLFLTSILLGVNWFTYIWAVNAGYIVETSLGYFINPLVNVILGVIFFNERFRRWQWISVMIAFSGIVYLTWQYGSLPWISLVLSISFAFYGLIKKKTTLNSTQGVAVETGILFFPAFLYLLVLESSGKGAIGNQTVLVVMLLIFAGVTTGIPLLLFSSAAKRINLSILGFLQYIAPTLQFLIGVFFYDENISQEKLIGFSLIWIALVIFSIEGVINRRIHNHLFL